MRTGAEVGMLHLQAKERRQLLVARGQAWAGFFPEPPGEPCHHRELRLLPPELWDTELWFL